jgi:membrane protease YdiL (CAAX protease family)
VFGGWGIIYVSYIFAILHIGFLSWIDVVFVFGVALFFGWVVKKTGSLLGVTLSHGITNIILFIVAQFYF